MAPRWDSPPLPTTCFTASRVGNSIFKIVEDDIYSEQPIIYVRIYYSVILVIDSGCGGAARDPTVTIKSLRMFLETWPVADNGNRPLNNGGVKPYLLVQTHCHYDHIYGMEQFLGSHVIASSYSKSFIRSDLPTHSLCKYLGIRTPEYKITHWAKDGEKLFYHEFNMRLTIFHTPGHTPDSLAVWDDAEKMIFVGDTCYEWAPTIFPSEGDIVDWLGSVDKLLAFVREQVLSMIIPHPVLINCGHVTARGDALEILQSIHDFMVSILCGQVPISYEMMKRGENHVVYGTQNMDRFVIMAPERLIKEARQKLDI